MIGGEFTQEIGDMIWKNLMRKRTWVEEEARREA